MLVLSGMHVLNTISDINISEAQRQAKPTPSEPILPPKPSVDYHVDESVTTLGAMGKQMCKGEFESLKAIHVISPGFVPEPYARGMCSQESPETCFLLAEFRNIGEQSEGRVLKPCLIHGDCWDGEAFIFDACSFYGHNEYDIGNWRAPRHSLSNETYMRDYKSRFPASPPEDDWDARNLLYSLTFNISNTIYIPGSSQRQVVYDDMTTLCKIFCADDLKRDLKSIGSITVEKEPATAGVNADEEGGEEGEEEAMPTTFTAVRACIFDLDDLLINSEDIYTEIYNSTLHSYSKPDLP
ncbi:MAG: hypothetical protein Q9161_007944 [Pseudevernia consocians]